MKSLTAGLLLAATVLLAPPAIAQLAPNKGPIDITANQMELIDAEHLQIWRGDVDALQGQNRLRADVLNVYFTSKPSAAKASSNGPGGGLGSTWGNKVDHMVADGHVFFVSPSQTVRGDRAVYELASDTITVTGDVIAVQGQNVLHGDKLVIDVKTGRASMVSPASAGTERVRGIFYSNQINGSQGASAAPASQP